MKRITTLHLLRDRRRLLDHHLINEVFFLFAFEAGRPQFMQRVRRLAAERVDQMRRDDYLASSRNPAQA